MQCEGRLISCCSKLAGNNEKQKSLCMFNKDAILIILVISSSQVNATNSDLYVQKTSCTHFTERIQQEMNL